MTSNLLHLMHKIPPALEDQIFTSNYSALCVLYDIAVYCVTLYREVAKLPVVRLFKRTCEPAPYYGLGLGLGLSVGCR